MSSQNENSFLSHHIQTVHQRTQTLYDAARGMPWRQPELMVACLEELRLALEELRVAEEEISQQNETLITTQQAVEEERQRYQELFEFAPDGYIITDAYGGIQEANRVAGLLLNVDPRYLINKPLTSFVAEDHRRSFRSLLNQLPNINRVQEWEVQLCKRGTGAFNAALTVETVRDGEDHPVALRWLLRDITARKQAEEQLRQVQVQNLELQELDRLKNQFLSTISHELRTPMSAILGFSHLLQVRTQHLDEQLSDMANRITRSGKHLSLIHI